MKIYMMRHCATQEGPQDDPDRGLDPTGALQAHVMRKFLKRVNVKPDMIISSDFARAEETAKIMQRGDTPLKTTPFLRPDGDVSAASKVVASAWKSVLKLAGDSKSVLIITHGPLIQALLASIAFNFLDTEWFFEHGSIAYVNTNESRFRWFVTPKLAAHIIGKKNPKKVENVVEAEEIARGALSLAENLMANTRAATITPLRNQMRRAIGDRWKRQLKRVKRAIRKSRGLDATSAQAMLATVIPFKDPKFSKRHNAVKRAAYQTGVHHAAGQLGIDIGGAVQAVEAPFAPMFPGRREAMRKPIVPTPDKDSINDQGYNLEDELDKTTVTRAHNALADIASTFTVGTALAAMTDLFNGFEDPGSGKLSRADTVALQTVSDGYHAGGKDTAAEVSDAGEQIEKQWDIGDEGCPICQANADEGWIPNDEPHGSGDLEPPAHPNCDCSESYRIADKEDSND
jgi:phosphohistidine phosphatase SixA